MAGKWAVSTCGSSWWTAAGAGTSFGAGTASVRRAEAGPVENTDEAYDLVLASDVRLRFAVDPGLRSAPETRTSA
ncbi:hypothetical protein [Streptomyces sp. NPDC050287]|uniref:hypothetical protein n=1 Tax=Streptomyces sp. NPDC050287 TaxID=3365608 RepID=UPI0037A2DD8D